MVTFRNFGRLGNFLFEAATAMAYSFKHGLEFSMPTTVRPGHPCYFSHLVNPNWNPNLETITIEERQHTFYELPFAESWRDKNIILHGYWQSFKYFVEYRDKIIEAFRLEWGGPLNGCVSVHIRRGDYLTIKKGNMLKHPPVTKEWIEAQMAKFSEAEWPGYTFRFFSDDIEWAKAEFGDRSGCYFSEGRDEMLDLQHMSWCEHNICSASTFSLWACWLNQNPDKRCIFPRHWITPGWSKLDFSQMVPPEYERA